MNEKEAQFLLKAVETLLSNSNRQTLAMESIAQDSKVQSDMMRRIALAVETTEAQGK